MLAELEANLTVFANGYAYGSEKLSRYSRDKTSELAVYKGTNLSNKKNQNLRIILKIETVSYFYWVDDHFSRSPLYLKIQS